MNTDGSQQTHLITQSELDVGPVWSPDGTKLVFKAFREGGNWDISVTNKDGSGQIFLTDEGYNTDPAWSPDGTRIAFVTNSHSYGIFSLDVINVDGSRQITQALYAAGDDSDPAWSPDGKQIAFVRSYSVNDREINWAFNIGDSGSIGLQTNSSVNTSPVWSPDGTQFAFVANFDGNKEIYVYMIVTDGSENWISLTNDPAIDTDPAWQPLL